MSLSNFSRKGDIFSETSYIGMSFGCHSFVDLNNNLFENSFCVTTFLKPLPFCSCFLSLASGEES